MQKHWEIMMHWEIVIHWHLLMVKGLLKDSNFRWHLHLDSMRLMDSNSHLPRY